MCWQTGHEQFAKQELEIHNEADGKKRSRVVWKVEGTDDHDQDEVTH